MAKQICQKKQRYEAESVQTESDLEIYIHILLR